MPCSGDSDYRRGGTRQALHSEVGESDTRNDVIDLTCYEFRSGGVERAWQPDSAF